jgi:hypothetical protein
MHLNYLPLMPPVPSRKCQYAKHPSPATVIITNTPVNNTARQLQNTWKHTGGGSATDCGRFASPFMGLLKASV